MTFNDLKLSAPLLKAVSEAGYEPPSPIQASAIPPVLEGRDLMGCAQTGTGKTAAFALPMLDRLSAAAPRKKGAARFFEILGRDFSTIWLAGILAMLGGLPFAAGVWFAVETHSLIPLVIAGVLGVILMDVWQGIELRMNGIDQAVHLGGAGAVDVVVISGLLAVILSELIGEILERAARGSNPRGREFTGGEIIKEGRRK